MHFIREWRKAKNMTQEQLAGALNVAVSTVSQLENGKQGYSQPMLQAIANVFGCEPADLLTRNPLINGRNRTITSDLALVGLEVVGTVQAGHFRDITLEDQDGERERIMVATDARFAHAQQYALKVAGDSMDLKFPEGSYVVCVERYSSGLRLKPGMVVHVERSVGGGQLVETTLKEIASINGETVLVPRSSNPKHKPLVIVGGEETEVQIKGIVIWKTEPVNF
jgi:transcriptional regulator with XRE-family HTH domain